MIEGTATAWVYEYLQEEGEFEGESGDTAYMLNREVERVAAANPLQAVAHFIEWRVSEEITRGLKGVQLRLITAALEGVDWRDLAESYKYQADEREAIERNLI